jgi:hypothetical protein
LQFELAVKKRWMNFGSVGTHTRRMSLVSSGESSGGVFVRVISACSAAVAALLWCSAAGAQTAAAPARQPKPLASSIASHPDWPKVKKADAESVDALIAALYDVISGPAGKPRDWDRFRSLFLPDGRLGVIRHAAPAADGRPAHPDDVVFLTPQDYIDRDAPFFKTEGFFERGIANRVEHLREPPLRRRPEALRARHQLTADCEGAGTLLGRKHHLGRRTLRPHPAGEVSEVRQ